MFKHQFIALSFVLVLGGKTTKNKMKKVAKEPKNIHVDSKSSMKQGMAKSNASNQLLT